MSKSMFIVSIVVGLMIGIAFGSTDATAGLSFSNMAPCQKILLKPGIDTPPFITGYRCKGFGEPGKEYIDECHCYEAIGDDTFRYHGTEGACEDFATCACDGFWDHFNTSKTDYLCDGEGFAHRDHLFYLWRPKINHHSIFGEGDTANLICSPDESCQTDCQDCFPPAD